METLAQSRVNAVPLLGGIIGAGVLMQILASLGLDHWPLWISTALSLGCVAALCYAHPRHVVIIITSFEGAAILLSGLIPILSASPVIFRFFQGMSRNSNIFLPFLLMVPTMVGVFLQMADSHRRDSGIIQG
jgi:hypothetical protein